MTDEQHAGLVFKTDLHNRTFPGDLLTAEEYHQRRIDDLEAEYIATYISDIAARGAAAFVTKSPEERAVIVQLRGLK